MQDHAGAAVAVLLAAGSGSRFAAAEHKLLALLPADGDRPTEPVVARSLAAVCAALADGPLTRAVVVTGAADVGSCVQHVVDEFGLTGRVVTAHNARFADGQATSIRVGLDAAERLDATVAVVGLADQPSVSAPTWSAVARAAMRPGASPIAVATYDEQPRNPVAVHRSVWDQLPTSGDRGARDLIRLHPELITPVPSLGSPADIDTVEDLRRWQSN